MAAAPRAAEISCGTAAAAVVEDAFDVCFSDAIDHATWDAGPAHTRAPIPALVRAQPRLPEPTAADALEPAGTEPAPRPPRRICESIDD